MADKSWKKFERDVAKKMGGERIGPSGTDTNDVSHDSFAIECKYRKSIPKLLTDGLKQADKLDLRTPVLFIKEKGKDASRDMVCMWADDFYNWFGVDDKGEK